MESAMSMHTSGPWEVVDHDHYPSIRVLKGPSFRVSAVVSATDLTFEDFLQREADLQLMASAPELLTALKSLRSRIHGTGFACAVREELEAADEAIAKGTSAA